MNNNIQNAWGRIVRAGDPNSKTNQKIISAVDEVMKVISAEIGPNQVFIIDHEWVYDTGYFRSRHSHPIVEFEICFSKMMTNFDNLAKIQTKIILEQGKPSEVINRLIAMQQAIMNKEHRQ